MARHIVWEDNDGQLVDVEPKVLNGRCGREVYDLRRKLDPLQPVAIVPVAYRDARETYNRDDESVRLVRTDTGASVMLSDVSDFVGSADDFCFVGLADGHVVTVIIHQSNIQLNHGGGSIASAYNWPDSASQTNLV